MFKRLVLAALVIPAFVFTADEEKKKSTVAERRTRFRTGIKEVKDLLGFAIKKQDQLEQATIEQFELIEQRRLLDETIATEQSEFSNQEMQLLKGRIQVLEKQMELSDLKQQRADLKIEENRCRCNCHCNSNSSASSAQQQAPHATAQKSYDHPLVLLNGKEQDNAI